MWTTPIYVPVSGCKLWHWHLSHCGGKVDRFDVVLIAHGPQDHHRKSELCKTLGEVHWGWRISTSCHSFSYWISFISSGMNQATLRSSEILHLEIVTIVAQILPDTTEHELPSLHNVGFVILCHRAPHIWWLAPTYGPDCSRQCYCGFAERTQHSLFVLPLKIHSFLNPGALFLNHKHEWPGDISEGCNLLLCV